MKKVIFITSVFVVVLLLNGCSNNLYFGTSNSVGLNVSGTSKIPNNVSFAFNRTELAVVPDDSNGNPHSVFASLDSEWTWFSGFYVKQNFATGIAADIASKGSPDGIAGSQSVNTSNKPLVFVTGTKLGIDIEFGQTTSTPMSFLVGYRRAEMTLMPDVGGKQNIDPVFADISIVSTDSAVTDAAEAPLIGGVRIKQRFATGKAAINAAANREMSDKLRNAVYGDPTLAALVNGNSRFIKEAAIQNEFSKMDSSKQQAYLQTLNQIFIKSPSDLMTPDNLQVQVGTLNDTQLDVAIQQL